MKVIFISNSGRFHQKITINIWLHILLPFILLLLLIAGVVAYQSFYHDKIYANKTDTSIINNYQFILKRLADLEGQTKRLNELGAYIARQKKLDVKAFNLDAPPAQGGLGFEHLNQTSSPILSEENLFESLVNSEGSIIALEKQFKAFQTSLITSSETVTQSYVPHYVSPVSVGYISSSFGMRRDPINGLRKKHNGIDLAARKGTAITPIAHGFVTFAGRKGAYGNMVEVQHSPSLKSRYAHLEKILVKKGDVVKQGDKIATMGDTGRVTGPHLHLEVWKDNKAINPRKFLKQALSELLHKS